MQKLLILFVIILGVSACGTNPVTGKRQITFMSQAGDNSLGQQQYAPSQQSEGGKYIIDPKLNAYVSRIGLDLARRSAQPNLPYEFVVLNNHEPNAWALPGGKIAINRGLLVLLEDEAQLASVLAHEVVHAAARHGAERQATNFGISVLAQAATAQTDNQFYRQAASMGAGGFQAFYSRDNELEADHYGINYMVAAGYNPYGAVELQQAFLKLSKERGGNADWFSALFASHPPSQERVDKNRARAASLPKGKRNKQAFLNATRQLRRDQPAYEKHQQALKAASQKQWQKAIKLTDQAIQSQPNEARFHITRGRLLNREQKNSAAMAAFNRAVALEPDYFQTRLYRGLLLNEQRKYSQAKQDLEASHRRLPTQIASYYLGEIAQRNRQTNAAIRYYRQAAQSGGDLGQAANARLKRMGSLR